MAKRAGIAYYRAPVVSPIGKRRIKQEDRVALHDEGNEIRREPDQRAFVSRLKTREREKERTSREISFAHFQRARFAHSARILSSFVSWIHSQNRRGHRTFDAWNLLALIPFMLWSKVNLLCERRGSKRSVKSLSSIWQVPSFQFSRRYDEVFHWWNVLPLELDLLSTKRIQSDINSRYLSIFIYRCVGSSRSFIGNIYSRKITAG